MTRAQQWSPVVTVHGEGAVWDEQRQRLRCVDMLAGDVLTLGPDGELEDREHVGAVAAMWRPRAGGGSVVATERGFRLVDAAGAVVELGPLWSSAASLRMNEGGCSPDGSLYCGSMAYDARPGAGTLWRLSPTLQTSAVLNGLTVSNGLAWMPDGRTARWTDSATRRIDSLTTSPSGEITARVPFVHLAADTGDPDGLTVDAEGGVWVALWGGSAVHRYAADGTLSHVVELPVPQVTSVALGGSDLRTLFVTTSAHGMVSNRSSPAGAVFVANAEVTGLLATPFSG